LAGNVRKTPMVAIIGLISFFLFVAFLAGALAALLV
jgi:hypothetical protein